jgi:two-component system, LytTR family, sensor kinase
MGKTIAIHVLGWTAFYLFNFILFSIPFTTEILFRYSLGFISIIILYYTNSEIFIPRLLAKKKVGLYILTLAACMTAIALYYLWIQITFHTKYFYENDWFKYWIINRSSMNALLALTVSSSLKMTKEWFKNERLKKEMENEKLVSELAFLKSQVNPHFLFNNLNNIYSLANKKSDDAGRAIVMLSELMRYMLYDSSAEKIGLEKEVEYLKNYIELQKLRIRGEAEIFFDIEGSMVGKNIEPMLLEPFVENAFKHSDIFQRNSSIFIELKVTEDSIYFKVKNSVGRIKHSKDKNSGIGLQNIRRRLKLLYPQRHNLTIEENPDHFTVELNLFLQPQRELTEEAHDQVYSY